MFTASLFHQVLPSFAWTEPFRLDRFSRDPFCNLHMWKHHFRTRVVIRRQTCPRRLAADLSRITVMRNSLIRQNPSVYDGKKDRKEFRCRRKVKSGLESKRAWVSGNNQSSVKPSEISKSGWWLKSLDI